MNTLTKNYIKAAVLCLCFSLFSTFAVAQQRGEGEQGGRKGPPPEATQACSSSTEGAVCEFEGRRGQVSGTCIIPGNTGTALACKPSNQSERGGRDNTDG